jgi:adenine deaminase
MESRFKLIDVALGKLKADFMITNANLVNVYSREYNEGFNVLIYGNRIAYVGEDSDFPKPKRMIDAQGRYVIPGLIDSHLHVESTYLTPNRLSEILVPLGTTAIFIDPHEFCNVVGVEGLNYFLGFKDFLPLKIYVEIPSDVPFDPEFSTSGGEINLYDIEDFLKKDGIIGLGEIMDFNGVLNKNPFVLEKLDLASKSNGTIEGHAVGLLGKKLSAYISTGIESDHESYMEEEAIQKIRLGMTLEIRQGSYAKNLSTLLKPIIKNKLDINNCILVTDDIHISDILHHGHINYLVSLAIKEGLDPIDAIKMATVNAARHFNLDKELGSITPGRIADLIILDDIKEMKITNVLTNGIKITSKNIASAKLSTKLSPNFLKTIRAKKLLRESDLEINIKSEKADQETIIIDLNYPNAITKRKILKLPIMNSKIGILPPEIAKCVVVERHKKTGNIAIGFVKGFNLEKGAITTSISHDSHNIIAIGADDTSIISAINYLIDIQGGIVVSNQKEILDHLNLSIGGLMSDEDPHYVGKKIDQLHTIIKKLGVTIENPITYLSFLTLTAIPELRITDKGLIDTIERKIITIFP